MRENRPSGSEGGVALIPPSLRLSCAAATPHGASELAQRLECARLLALSVYYTAAGNLPPTPILQACSTPEPIRCSPDDIALRWPACTGARAG